VNSVPIVCFLLSDGQILLSEAGGVKATLSGDAGDATAGD